MMFATDSGAGVNMAMLAHLPRQAHIPNCGLGDSSDTIFDDFPVTRNVMLAGWFHGELNTGGGLYVRHTGGALRLSLARFCPRR